MASSPRPKPQQMDLDINVSFNKRLITPYRFKDKVYYLLFYANNIQGPFYVEDAPYESNLLITIGEIKKRVNNKVIGNIFFTQSNVVCEGSYLLAYSGVFKHSVNTRKLNNDLSVELILKTPYMHVFSQMNKATLVVSPMLKTTIKQNLEI